MLVKIIVLFSIFSTSTFGKESLLEPAWQHCVHPLHAMPKGWGEVISPGFPNGMKTQLQCSWMVDANPGWRIKIAFHTLNMTGDRKSCYTQFVQIYDLKTSRSIGKFCGTSKPGDYVSEGSKVRIDLQGDTTGQATKGFKLKFKATKESPGFKSKFSFPDKPPPSSTFRGGGGGKPAPTPNPKFAGNGGRVDIRRIQGIRDGTITVKPRVVKKKGNGTAEDDEASPAKPGPPKKFGNAPANKRPQGGRQQPPQGAKPPQGARPPTGSNNQGGARPSNQLFRPAYRPAAPSNNYKPSANIYGSNVGMPEKPVVVVTYGEDDDQPEINLYLVIGLAVGGVVFIIILFVIIKKCCFDKSKKKKNKDGEKAPDAKANGGGFKHEKDHPPSVDHVIKTRPPPEMFLMEEIVQQKPYPPPTKRKHSSKPRPKSMADGQRYYREADLPMVFTLPRSDSHFPMRTKSTRSTTGFERSKSSRSMHRRTKSSRSINKRTQSSRSRNPEFGRTASRADRKRPKSTFTPPHPANNNNHVAGSYFDFQTGQWVFMAPQPAPTKYGTMPHMGYQHEKDHYPKHNYSYDDSSTEDSTTSYSDTSSSSDEASVSTKRRNRRSLPPPYEMAANGYYMDDSYSTGKSKKKRKDRRPSYAASSMSRGRKDKSRRKKKGGHKHKSKKMR